MPTLVVDACALVHLKQARSGPNSGLVLLERACAAGMTLTSTKKVHQENQAQTLSIWLDARVQAYALESVTPQERKWVANQLKRGMTEPGDNDKALIALARRLSAPLLTHDGPAAMLANRCAVLVIDAIDLAWFGHLNGFVTLEEAEALVAPLGAHAWRPPSWAGSIAATIPARPRWDALHSRLLRWWRP